MPYDVRKVGTGYDIVKKDTGEVVGHSTSKRKAFSSIRARYASEHNHPWYRRKKT